MAYPVWIATALVLGGACAKQPASSADMTSHFSQAHSVHTAIIFGDLDAARMNSRALATHEDVGIPSRSGAWVDRMKQAAIHVADAWHLEAAAVGSGDMVAACGSCHRAFDAGPAVGTVWKPDQLPGARAHMDRHRWALDRMWDGMMIPSDERWVQGAEALREEPLDADRLAEIAGESGEEWGREIHEMGHVARGLSDPSRRSEMYSRILRACVHCHEATRDAE